MGIISLIGMLFGADVAAPPDAMRLDATTETTLTRSLSALLPDERGWITFAEARTLFSSKGAQYAFGETDQDGRKNIQSFEAQHRSVVNFMPFEERVYFVSGGNNVRGLGDWAPMRFSCCLFKGIDWVSDAALE